MLATGRFIEHVYKDSFDYGKFKEDVFQQVYDCIKFPSHDEVDYEFESIWEDVHEEDMAPMVSEMFERMGLDRLDGKKGFIFMDSLGYVECLAECGDDGKRYCTVSLAVNGALCIRPFQESCG